jgi:hypothetical protein
MRPRPLLLTGCFLLAVFAGKAAREARARSAEAQASTQQVAVPVFEPMPAGMDDLETRIWLSEHLLDAGSERLKEIATRLAATPDLEERAWEGLFSRWFEMDPAAAWAFAAGNQDLRPLALEEWAALDPDAARKAFDSPSLDDLAAVVRGALRRDVVRAFQLIDEGLAANPGTESAFLLRFSVEGGHLAEWASLNPEAAAAWAERTQIHFMQGALLWGRWKNDPAAAKAWLSQQERPDRHLSELAFFAGDSDHYQSALMDFLADALPAGNNRMEIIQQILEGLAYRDPDFAAKEAARVIPDEAMRAEAIGKIASLVAKTDFAKAWSLLETLDPSVQGIQRVQIPAIEIRAGSEADRAPPPFQYGWHLTSMRGLESPAEARRELLERLMETDKQEAIRLMEGLPSRSFSHSGSYAFWTWADRDYQEAVRWLAGKLGGEGGDEGIEEISDLVDRSASPDEISTLIDSLPPGTVRSALATLRVDELANTDPLAALQLAREASTAGEPVTRAYATWSSSDPVAALEHLAEDSAAPAEAWEVVVEDAFKKAPETTAQTIEALPDGPVRDVAISTVLESMGNSDPLEASAWALALGDTDKRKAAIEEVLGHLTRDLRLVRDPATADELRQQVEDAADLPDAERQRWLERIDFEFSGP